MGIFSKKTEEKSLDVAKKVVDKTHKSDKKRKIENDIASTTGAYGVILSPIITEKSHEMASKHKYTFRVAKTVSKSVIKRVVEDMYGVTVENVNVIVVKPKRRTVKQDRGYQKLYKKAIVTVSKKDHIAIFEGV